MTRLRLRSPEFGDGNCEWLKASDDAVLAHSCAGERSCVFAIHNLSEREVEVDVVLGRHVNGLFDLLDNRENPVAEDGTQHFRLKPYGFVWLRDGHGPENLAGTME
jgi:hypothetical protein